MTYRISFLFLAVAALPLGAQEPSSASAPQVRLHLASGTECLTIMSYPRMEKWRLAHQHIAKEPPVTVVKRTLLYTGDDASLSSVLSNKTSRSEFFRGPYYLALDSQTGTQISERGSGDAPDVDFRKVHFPELSWVNESHNRGIQKTPQGKCLVYEVKTASPVSQRLLHVDPETLYPVFYQSFNETMTYSYSPATVGGRIPLPSELDHAWEKIRGDYKRYFKKDIIDAD